MARDFEDEIGIQDLAKDFMSRFGLSQNTAYEVASNAWDLLNISNNLCNLSDVETVKEVIRVKRVLFTSFVSWLYGIDVKYLPQLTNITIAYLEYISETLPHTEVMNLPSLLKEDDN